MKRLLCLLTVLLLSFPLCVRAAGDDPLSLLASKDGAGSVQAWMDGPLTEGAGVSSEWCVIALMRGENAPDPSRYAAAAKKALETEENPMTRQRIALALLACGGETDTARTVASETYGSRGIMSEIFGLLLLNASSPSEAAQKAPLLASEMLEGGGFALSGSRADPDVTAMALTALAPHRENAAVSEAIGQSLSALSAMQADDGTFSSYGVSNPESCAQVLIALTSLGVSVSDPRFVRDKTIPEGILSFRTPDGYAHKAGGETNRLATVQAALAFCALSRAERGLPSLFDLRPTLFPETETSGTDVPASFEIRTSEQETAGDAVTDRTDSGKTIKQHSAKPLILAGIWCSAALLLFILYRKGRAGRGNLLFVAVCAILCTILVLTVKIRSADEYYGEQTDPVSVTGTVQISVRCDALIGEEGIPKDGILLPSLSLPIPEGASVYDLLLSASKKERFQLGAQGGGTMVYVASIFQLSEMQFGTTSGWVYYVNGVSPSVGCGEYLPKDGDVIEFRYVRSLGEIGFSE